MAISTIGRYQILERLGQGGMGVVYRAFDPQIERTVAIKVISAQLVDQPEHRERFFREARAAGRLAHRNIITIFDLGEDNGQPYIAMEYVEGQSLEVRMRSGEPLTLPQKVGIIIDLCDALAFAHAAGIVHRDMKPGNVMLTTSGSARILDFGLARLVTSELTRSNVVVGTMNYMAPEQVRAEAIDHRADIFSVGVLFYELLSGRKAFEADSFAATMYKVLQERPAPLGAGGPHIPQAVAAIVDRAIEKDRSQRYQTMGDMLRDLEGVRAALPPGSRIHVPGDAVAGLSASSSREIETTLDAPRVLVPHDTALVSLPMGRAAAGSAGRDASAAGATPASRARTPPPDAPPIPGAARTPSSVEAATARASQFVPLISAAALVVIAIAVIAFVMRPPAERPVADPAPRAASEQPPAPAVPPAAVPSAPATAHDRDPAVSVTDNLAQQTESARALYRAGKYDEAARTAGQVLKRAPGNADAQRVMTDVARYARHAATEAVSGLAAARARAESVGAPTVAAAAFARAVERERIARALIAASDHAKATTTAYEAQGLFEAAAAESAGRRAEARATADPPVTRAQPAPAPEEPRPAATLPNVSPIPAPAAVAAPPATPAPPVVVERRASDPQEGIRRTLQQYTAALEGRSLQALKQVWPGLGGAQERAIKAEFDNARQISVTLDAPRIQTSGDAATVVAIRRYALATTDGHELRSDTRSTFQLRAVDGHWIIESVRFEQAR